MTGSQGVAVSNEMAYAEAFVLVMAKVMTSPSPTQLKQLSSSQLGVLPHEQFFVVTACLPASTPGMLRLAVPGMGSSVYSSASIKSIWLMLTSSEAPSSRLS